MNLQKGVLTLGRLSPSLAYLDDQNGLSAMIPSLCKMYTVNNPIARMKVPAASHLYQRLFEAVLLKVSE